MIIGRGHVKKAAVLAAAVLLSALFALIGVLLLFNRESRRLIRWKLRVGALLITLNGLTLTGCLPPVITCYAPLPPDWLVMETEYYDETESGMVISYPPGGILHGSVNQMQSSSFSWMIIDGGGELAGTGPLLLTDGTADTMTEDVHLSLPALDPGEYGLYFFNEPVEVLPGADQSEEIRNRNIRSYILRVP
jgi:hypothetical protein